MSDILIGLGSAVAGAVMTFGGAVMLHFREIRKIKSDGQRSSAETQDIHWKRFEREIDRLCSRVEKLEDEVRECHQQRHAAELELERLKLTLIERGNARQTAQMVISEQRIERDRERRT